MYEQFIRQAEIDTYDANAQTWLLITKRDGRLPMIFMSTLFKKKLVSIGCKINKCCPSVCLSFLQNNKPNRIFGLLLEDFLNVCTPKYIKEIYKEQNKLRYYYCPIEERQIEIVFDTKEDQTFKCTNCDEVAVQWINNNWICTECETINEYPK